MSDGKVIRVRIKCALHKTNKGWEAIAVGFERGDFDDDCHQRVEDISDDVWGSDHVLTHWRWIEADVPVPVDDEPMIDGVVSDA